MKIFNKFLVVRRDGTVPDWPYLVLGARDPAAPAALRTLAENPRGWAWTPNTPPTWRRSPTTSRRTADSTVTATPTPHRTGSMTPLW